MEKMLLTISENGDVQFSKENPLAPVLCLRYLTNYVQRTDDKELFPLAMAMLLEHRQFMDAMRKKAEERVAEEKEPDEKPAPSPRPDLS